MERMRDREDGKAKEGALAGRRVAWEALTTPGRTDDLSGLLLALEQIAHGLLHRAGTKRDAQQAKQRSIAETARKMVS